MATTSISGAFEAQWLNPSSIAITVLLLIGADIVRAALAQLAGGQLPVVAFSFGWVAYSFQTLISMGGEGRLMPDPDFPCKVINVGQFGNGNTRENKSWLVGRILRDSAPPVEKEGLIVTVWEINKDAKQKMKEKKENDREVDTKHKDKDKDKEAKSKEIRDKPEIDYEAQKRKIKQKKKRGTPERHPDAKIDHVEVIALVCILFQFAISVIPWIVYGNWGIFVITMAGTTLAVMFIHLPQWSTEKYACRNLAEEGRGKRLALTQGNGSLHVMLIFSEATGLNLEDLAGPLGPRIARIWMRYGLFVKTKYHSNGEIYYNNDRSIRDGAWFPANSNKAEGRGRGNQLKDVKLLNDYLPLDFWFTRGATIIFLLLWVALLISVAAIQQNVWYLFWVGAVGMAQNGYVASARREPWARGLHMKQVLRLGGMRVMDVLMDVEVRYQGSGKALLGEFFELSSLDNDEKDWWFNGNRGSYDKKRETESYRATSVVKP